MNARCCNGGSNMAECLVSGRIAKTNAALGVKKGMKEGGRRVNRGMRQAPPRPTGTRGPVHPASLRPPTSGPRPPGLAPHRPAQALRALAMNLRTTGRGEPPR